MVESPPISDTQRLADYISKFKAGTDEEQAYVKALEAAFEPQNRYTSGPDNIFAAEIVAQRDAYMANSANILKVQQKLNTTDAKAVQTELLKEFEGKPFEDIKARSMLKAFDIYEKRDAAPPIDPKALLHSVSGGGGPVGLIKTLFTGGVDGFFDNLLTGLQNMVFSFIGGLPSVVDNIGGAVSWAGHKLNNLLHGIAPETFPLKGEKDFDEHVDAGTKERRTGYMTSAFGGNPEHVAAFMSKVEENAKKAEEQRNKDQARQAAAGATGVATGGQHVTTGTPVSPVVIVAAPPVVGGVSPTH